MSYYRVYRGASDYVGQRSTMQKVFLWMTLGMLVTAIVAYITAETSLIDLANSPAVFVAIIIEFGIVFGLSAGINRISAGTALVLFFAFAGLNGFTLSLILLSFDSKAVFSAFVATTGLFGAMAIVGATTRADLSSMGTYLMMGVIGLVVAIVVNIFLASSGLDYLISIAGVLIFTGLTAYDTQRIQHLAETAEGESDTQLGIIGALTLYLDFLNLFLFLLRLFGGSSRR
jgi:FtsH-binding integral membrane protein